MMNLITDGQNTLLKFRDDIALIGEIEGSVHIETRPAELSSGEWLEHLRGNYLEPGNWYKDEDGFPHEGFLDCGIGEGGQMVAVTREYVAPYKSFTDESSGLSVRAAFETNTKKWIIDDREHELDQFA